MALLTFWAGLFFVVCACALEGVEQPPPTRCQKNPPSSDDNPKCHWTLPNTSWGTTLPLLRTTIKYRYLQNFLGKEQRIQPGEVG